MMIVKFSPQAKILAQFFSTPNVQLVYQNAKLFKTRIYDFCVKSEISSQDKKFLSAVRNKYQVYS